MNNTVKILIETLYKGHGTKQSVEALKGLKGKYRELNDSFNELEKTLKPVAKGIGIATAAIVGFGVAGKKAFEFLEQGAALDFTAIKFERLAQSIGTTSDALLVDMSRATRGTLSDMELMASAADLVGLGLVKNREEAVRLATVQAGLAMDMNQLVLTLTNQTTMRFDALGVSTDGFKEKVKELEDAGYDASDAFKEAFLQQAEDQLEKVGYAADTTYGSYQRLTAQIKTQTDTWKEHIAVALEPAVKWLADATQRSNDYEKAVRISELSYRDFGKAARDAGMNVNEYTQYVLDSAAANQDFVDSEEDVVDASEDTEEAIKRQSDAYKTLLSNMFKIQDANERFVDDEEKRAEKQKDLEEEKVRIAIEAGNKQKDLKRDLAELDRDIAKARGDATYKQDQIDTDAAERAVANAKTKEARKKAETRLEEARADAAKRRAKAESDSDERIHDLMVRREKLLEKIQDAQQEAVVTQVEIDEKLAQLEEDKTDAIEDQEKARKKLVYGMLEQKAAQDGIISSDEVKFLQDTAVQMGFVDRASADMAIAAAEAADMMWEQFQKPGEAVGDIQAALNRVVQGSPYRAQIQIEQVVTSSGIGYENQNDMRRGRSFKLSEDYKNTVGYENLNDRRRGRSYAEGGSFIIPERFGYEGFSLGGIATASGGERVTVTPQGKSNGNININITGVVDRRMVKYLKQEITRLQAD